MALNGRALRRTGSCSEDRYVYRLGVTSANLLARPFGQDDSLIGLGPRRDADVVSAERKPVFPDCSLLSLEPARASVEIPANRVLADPLHSDLV